MLTFAFDDRLNLQISADGASLALASAGLWLAGADLLAGHPRDIQTGAQGASASFTLPSGGLIRLELKLAAPAPDALSLAVTLTNLGNQPVDFDRLAAPTLALAPAAFPLRPELWSMQGAAVRWGQDFAFPLKPGFKRQNFLGHLQDGEGGGVPLVYFWNRARGLALMHIETTPQDWHMPVDADGTSVRAGLELRGPRSLAPGESLSGLQTVISLHKGDFFAPLALYRQLMTARGLASPAPVPADFEPGWCSWGYEFDVRPDEMTGVLPALDELGIRWLTLDDRWFDAYADWNPRLDTFPGGEADIVRMNAAIHAAGAFSQVWWYPLCIEDGYGHWESHTYEVSQTLRDHPDWLVLNADGSVARNNRHLAMLCPALPEVREHNRQMTLRFIRDWGFDGHKLDNIYTMPACHNPAHHHARPGESTEALALAYRDILEITRALRPDSITQICPCGTPITFSLLSCTSQTVTADPTSSAQARQRIKFYKALAGPRSAVFADHVELLDGGADFASAIGAGGVPSTKFTWPVDASIQARLKEDWSLTDSKKVIWKNWFDLYNRHRPAEGEALNLYDIAFDQPEAHVLRKDGRLYYAFYPRPAKFNGRLELRGLDERPHRVRDYVRARELGRVDAAHPWLDVQFEGALLLVAEPE